MDWFMNSKMLSMDIYIALTRLPLVMSLGVPNNPMWFITVVSSSPWLSFTKIWNIMQTCINYDTAADAGIPPVTFTYCYAVHSLKFNKLQGENCVFLDIFFCQTRSKVQT